MARKSIFSWVFDNLNLIGSQFYESKHWLESELKQIHDSIASTHEQHLGNNMHSVRFVYKNKLYEVGQFEFRVEKHRWSNNDGWYQLADPNRFRAYFRTENMYKSWLQNPTRENVFRVGGQVFEANDNNPVTRPVMEAKRDYQNRLDTLIRDEQHVRNEEIYKVGVPLDRLDTYDKFIAWVKTEPDLHARFNNPDSLGQTIQRSDLINILDILLLTDIRDMIKEQSTRLHTKTDPDNPGNPYGRTSSYDDQTPRYQVRGTPVAIPTGEKNRTKINAISNPGIGDISLHGWSEYFHNQNAPYTKTSDPQILAIPWLLGPLHPRLEEVIKGNTPFSSSRYFVSKVLTGRENSYLADILFEAIHLTTVLRHFRIMKFGIANTNEDAIRYDFFGLGMYDETWKGLDASKVQSYDSVHNYRQFEPGRSLYKSMGNHEKNLLRFQTVFHWNPEARHIGVWPVEPRYFIPAYDNTFQGRVIGAINTHLGPVASHTDVSFMQVLKQRSDRDPANKTMAMKNLLQIKDDKEYSNDRDDTDHTDKIRISIDTTRTLTMDIRAIYKVFYELAKMQREALLCGYVDLSIFV